MRSDFLGLVFVPHRPPCAREEKNEPCKYLVVFSNGLAFPVFCTLGTMQEPSDTESNFVISKEINKSNVGISPSDEIQITIHLST